VGGQGGDREDNNCSLGKTMEFKLKSLRFGNSMGTNPHPRERNLLPTGGGKDQVGTREPFHLEKKGERT